MSGPVVEDGEGASESMGAELSFPCVDKDGMAARLVLAFLGDSVTFTIVSDSAADDGPRHWATALNREMRRVASEILSMLEPPVVAGDRRFELACFALSGLAPEFHKSGADENADDIGKRAVELADATLSALRSMPK
jgi:hypothetical protein